MSRTNRMGVTLALALLVGTPPLSAAGQDGNSPAPAETRSTTDIQPRPLVPGKHDYFIGVDDVLDVHIWKEPELSRVITVRPDGKISLPLVGELVAEGRTALELREIISKRLKNFVTQPEVTVIVQQVNSRHYFIIGEIQSPGAYPLKVPITVVQALAMAGGFREFADMGNIEILRRTNDKQTVRIKFSYKDWLKNKKPIAHLQLQNGDVIVVP